VSATQRTEATGRSRRPSLRRRLLTFLLIPMLLLLLLDALLTYTVALSYSNHVHDRALADDAVSLAELLRHESLPGDISSQARFLLDYDPRGRNFFNIRSRKRGLISGNENLPLPAEPVALGQPPVLSNATVDHEHVRAATIAIRNPRDAHDVLEISVAETLHDRQEVAREILVMSVSLQCLLIALLLALAWLGVTFGLRGLDPLVQRLARREHTLAPIDDSDVPVELLPLTRTIDGLFSRLRELMSLHERFVADAAHQLRTPLAGMALHVDRARAHPDDAQLHDALEHIQRLNSRAARTTHQLLALTRAQTPRDGDANMSRLDLAKLLPDCVGERVPEAIAGRIDLGYEGPSVPTIVNGNPHALQEMINNLLDNALRYAGEGGHVTVGLIRNADDACHVITVEDDGPGVPEAFLPRLGERFFRAPAAPEGGTGLGLAIVQRIAEHHGAEVVYARARSGGLRVEIRFPAIESGA
jgi:two-component system, OmpR family, sensor histidine kinase TctE